MVTRGGNRSRSFEVSFEDIIIKRILLSGLDDFELHPLLRMKYRSVQCTDTLVVETKYA